MSATQALLSPEKQIKVSFNSNKKETNIRQRLEFGKLSFPEKSFKSRMIFERNRWLF